MNALATTEVVMKRVLDGKRCPACGKRIEVYCDDTPIGEVSVSAYCHGSTDRILVSATSAKVWQSESLVRVLMHWVRDLFKLDASPDMRELLSYNAGALPVANAR